MTGSGPLRDQLVAAILTGEKTTTTGLHEEYRREGRPLEEPGQRSLVIDSDGRPVAVIEALEVELVALADVDLQFAIDEGEGFKTVEAWREAHVSFFTSPEIVADWRPTVIETTRLSDSASSRSC